jgi:hypothetical protein
MTSIIVVLIVTTNRLAIRKPSKGARVISNIPNSCWSEDMATAKTNNSINNFDESNVLTCREDKIFLY